MTSNPKLPTFKFATHNFRSKRLRIGGKLRGCAVALGALFGVVVLFGTTRVEAGDARGGSELPLVVKDVDYRTFVDMKVGVFEGIFIIRNPTDQPIIVDEVRTGCGCISFEGTLPFTIPSGGKFDANLLLYGPEMLLGEQVSEVVLVRQGKAVGQSKSIYTYEPKVRLHPWHSPVDLIPQKDARLSKEFVLTSQDRAELEAVKFVQGESEQPLQFELGLIQEEKGKFSRIATVSAPKNLDAGGYFWKVQVFSSAGMIQQYELKAFVEHPIRGEPKLILMNLRKGESMRRRLTLRASSEFKIESIEFSKPIGKWINPEIAHTPAARYDLDIEVNSDVDWTEVSLKVNVSVTDFEGQIGENGNREFRKTAPVIIRLSNNVQ
jgi:hypothetical protein